MTKVEIINETVEYYSKNPRGIDPIDGSCVYFSRDGSMCAVGRNVNDPSDFQKRFNGIMVYSIKYLDTYLKEQYRGHGYKFWSDMQSLHDNDRCWQVNGLTYYGKQRVRKLLKCYST